MSYPIIKPATAMLSAMQQNPNYFLTIVKTSVFVREQSKKSGVDKQVIERLVYVPSLAEDRPDLARRIEQQPVTNEDFEQQVEDTRLKLHSAGVELTSGKLPKRYENLLTSIVTKAKKLAKLDP